MTDPATTTRPGSSKAERLSRKQRGAGSSPARASNTELDPSPVRYVIPYDVPGPRPIVFDAYGQPLKRRAGF